MLLVIMHDFDNLGHIKAGLNTKSSQRWAVTSYFLVTVTSILFYNYLSIRHHKSYKLQLLSVCAVLQQKELTFYKTLFHCK